MFLAAGDAPNKKSPPTVLRPFLVRPLKIEGKDCRSWDFSDVRFFFGIPVFFLDDVPEGRYDPTRLGENKLRNCFNVDAHK